MFANGQQSVIKSWNNIHLYFIIRSKIKYSAHLVLNYLRYPQTNKAFRRWRGLVKD
jgi:hypothetical protein